MIDGPQIADLGRLVRERRTQQNQSVRQAAEEAGVSFSTISRVESGAQPDLATFLRLCAWLGEPPDRFLTPMTVRQPSNIEAALRHLDADPNLSEDAARAISRVVRDMYKALASASDPAKPMVLHLRAANALRPGVPERLASLLADMRSALEEQAGARTR